MQQRGHGGLAVRAGGAHHGQLPRGVAIEIGRELPERALPLPQPEPLAGLAAFGTAAVAEPLLARWPAADAATLRAEPAALARLPIDHSVAVVAERCGGARAGAGLLQDFLRRPLKDYAEHRSHPDDELASGLSPYIHFGQVGIHQIVAAVAERIDCDPASLAVGDWIHFP